MTPTIKKWIIWLLYAGPLVIACNQIVRSNFGNLTRWKGGGFGMYTEMYPEYRSVWLITESEDSSLVIKIHPITIDDRRKLDTSMREIYRQLRPNVRNLVHYPSNFNFESKPMKNTIDLLWERHKKIVGENPLIVKLEIQAIEFALEESRLESKLLYSKVF